MSAFPPPGSWPGMMRSEEFEYEEGEEEEPRANDASEEEPEEEQEEEEEEDSSAEDILQGQTPYGMLKKELMKDLHAQYFFSGGLAQLDERKQRHRVKIAQAFDAMRAALKQELKEELKQELKAELKAELLAEECVRGNVFRFGANHSKTKDAEALLERAKSRVM